MAGPYPELAAALRKSLQKGDKGEVRGNILPLRRNSEGGLRPAMPEMLRQAGIGLLDLLSASSTGEITPEAGEFMVNMTPAGGLSAAARPSAVGSLGIFGGNPGKYGKGPIKAYHGSPHDFDKFSLDRIGTGEGAQAYGHGLYFAENEDVAKGYRDTLARTKGTPQERARAQLDNFRGDRQKAIDWFEHNLAAERGKVYPDTDWLAQNDEVLAYLKRGEIAPQAGRMYEVAIHADPERFLDWDKPLKEQPTGETVKRLLTDRMIQPHDAMRGVNAYGELGTHYDQIFARKPGLNADEDVTKVLRRAGIPGIKYLDQGSRSSGDGSRNYVVFDDNVIEILRKYGLVPTGVGAPALAGSANQDTRDRRGLLDALNTLN
jgi:hypothetical protein